MAASTARPTRGHERSSVTVRDWVLSPKTRMDPAGASGPVDQVLAGTGIRTTDWSLWEQANEGRPEDFLTRACMEFLQTMTDRFPTMPIDRAIAWMITLDGFYDREAMREIATWEGAGPLGWMYRAVGMDRREVAAAARDRSMPDETTLRMMAALRDTVLPLG